MKKTILLLTALFLISCSENDELKNTTNPVSHSEFAQNFGALISRDFIGQVVDINNSPVVGAMVSIGNLEAQTDENGVFMINSAEVNERFAYITAKKAGFIDGSRAMVPTTGKNKLKIMLLPNASIATISSGQTSEVVLPSGTKVIFDGRFQDLNGNNYNGNVNVSMFHLLPSNENIGSLMPGMLYGKGEDGEEKSLQTFGMLNVELRGESGQKLQLAAGHKAKVEMVIDIEQQGSAPSTIPLWHFDDVYGYWIQEGQATKVGNVYKGEVSHFSWWNCDVFESTINIQITIVDNNQLPISSANVVLTTASGITGSGLTNEDGQISGPIPINQNIIIEIYDICNNLIYSSTIGPFSTDTVITITIPIASQISKQIQGVLTDCNGMPVQNGYVMLTYDDQNLFSPVSNGEFNFQIITCPEANLFKIVGVDYSNLQYTGELTYTFSAENVKIGRIPACNNIDEFISFRVNQQSYTLFVEPFSNLPSSPLGFNADFIIRKNSPYGEVESFQMAIMDNFTIGVPTENGSLRVWYYNENLNQMSYIGFGLNTPNITITKYDPPGGYVDFTFNCTTSGANGPLTITGNGHVKR